MSKYIVDGQETTDTVSYSSGSDGETGLSGEEASNTEEEG